MVSLDVVSTLVQVGSSCRWVLAMDFEVVPFFRSLGGLGLCANALATAFSHDGVRRARHVSYGEFERGWWPEEVQNEGQKRREILEWIR